MSNLVANFQDLSAVLTLLAADTVERKLSDPRSLLWERMSTSWSLFGIIGLLRAYLKIAAGLRGAEAAGVELLGASGFTTRRTRSSLSCWLAGTDVETYFWRDDSNRLIGEARAVNSLWKRPHIIIVGFAKCPWEWKRRAMPEIILPVLWSVFTVSTAVLPVLCLIPLSTLPHDPVDILSIVMLGGIGAVAGCMLPYLLEIWNPIGVSHLQHTTDARCLDLQTVTSGDHVMTSKERKESVVLWQTENAPTTNIRGSADFILVRVLAGLAAGAILAGYVFNYVLLGRAPPSRSYGWLGIEVAILVIRYILWAFRPTVFHSRVPSLLYLVSGSIAAPLSAEQPEKPLQPHAVPKLPRMVVEFAVASAGSKLFNDFGSVSRLKLKNFLHLADAVPADILSCQYYDESSHSSDAKIIRLAWSFVEEMYAGLGIILGANPWALGGLYLGAVFENDEFKGLTTIHPVSALSNVKIRSNPVTLASPICDGSDIEKGDPSRSSSDGRIPDISSEFSSGGITYSGFIVDNLAWGSVVQYHAPISTDFRGYHDKFRANVAACRAAAVSNGPFHVELHASREKWGGHSRNTRTEPDLPSAFAAVHEIVQDAQDRTDHSQCSRFCHIHTFPLDA